MKCKNSGGALPAVRQHKRPPKKLLNMKMQEKRGWNSILAAGSTVIPKRLLPGLSKMLLLGLLALWLLPGQAQTIYLGDDPATGAQCHCLDNATTLLDGQFLDTVTVNSGVVGQTWTVTANTIGAFSPASPAPPHPDRLP